MHNSGFTLAIVDPAVVNNYGAAITNLPFYQVGHNGFDIGGPTGGRNQLLLDGADTRVEQRGSYAPPMDAVQEFVVQQNPVDAEFGNSAGAAISVATKSGTNELHGLGYYYGRNPFFNARPNVFSPTPSKQRDHIGGGNVGGPIWIPKVYNGKNKAFFFVSFEQWKMLGTEGELRYTLPTALERTGDFSKSLNNSGGQRVIYDPQTTVLDPATNKAARTPFAGNQIPAQRIDPAAAALMKYVWLPNNPGNDLNGTANFRSVASTGNPYTNALVRVDYQVSDKWKAYGRYSRQNQWQQPEQLVDSPAYFSGQSAKMYANNIAGNVDGILSPTLGVNFRFGYIKAIDELNLPFAMSNEGVWSSIWPSKWWSLMLKGAPDIYFPHFNVGGSSFGFGGGWNLRPNQLNYSGMMMKQRGSHYIKLGAKISNYSSDSALPDYGSLNFGGVTTASTYISAPTDVSGAAWASFLLGYPSDNSNSNYGTRVKSSSSNIGIFVQDDWKVSRNLTLNLGLRWEFDQAPTEDSLGLGRNLDLSSPIPEFTTTPPVFPDLSKYNAFPRKFNGAYQFLDSSNPRVFHAPKNVFLPRIGLAYRLNDQMSLRLGYSRYAVPFLTVLGPNWNLPRPGFSTNSTILAAVAGVPQTKLNDPFPAANPIQQPIGAARGRYSELGNSVTFWNQYPKQPTNDRINISVQRALPAQMRLDVTVFANLGHNAAVPGIWGGAARGQSLNMRDPALSYKFQSELDTAVTNPFYNYLTVDQFPGALRRQPRVSTGSLLVEYPQYGSITELYTPGAGERYYSTQIKLEKAMARGLGYTFGYNYSHGYQDGYFNADDQYARRYTQMDTLNYRHKLTVAPYWEIPLGKDRRYGAKLHPALQMIVGGWTTSHLFQYNSGAFIDFRSRQMKVNGDPILANPGADRWFQTQVFAPADPYTPRTNPYYYEGLNGPKSWNLDSTLAKNFPINERVRLEFRMDAFNTPNHVLKAGPNTDVRSANFGRSTTQANSGRQMQYTMRLHF
ncbi:MAG: TonB-dependent receptor [Acidobacteria bacterium]|nr:TonB-dependent receptor [Acidobacteriota bacterium]